MSVRFMYIVKQQKQQQPHQNQIGMEKQFPFHAFSAVGLHAPFMLPSRPHFPFVFPHLLAALLLLHLTKIPNEIPKVSINLKEFQEENFLCNTQIESIFQLHLS